MREKRLWAGFGLAILAYLLPWVINESSSLTMGAYDFAEWLSKLNMYEPAIYYPVLALRGQLLLLTVFLAFGAQKPYLTLDWWTRFVFGMLLIIAQFPALNMLPSIGTDINRQQQVILAGLSFVILILGLSGFVSHWRNWLWLVTAIFAFLSSVYGLINANDRMDDYALSPFVGFGAIIYLILMLVLGIFCVFQLRAAFYTPASNIDYAK
jgi:hypothetical protein